MSLICNYVATTQSVAWLRAKVRIEIRQMGIVDPDRDESRGRFGQRYSDMKLDPGANFAGRERSDFERIWWFPIDPSAHFVLIDRILGLRPNPCCLTCLLNFGIIIPPSWAFCDTPRWARIGRQATSDGPQERLGSFPPVAF
jgi:hypothetical protein